MPTDIAERIKDRPMLCPRCDAQHNSAHYLNQPFGHVVECNSCGAGWNSTAAFALECDEAGRDDGQESLF